ncbi:hypothetical protein HL667_33700 [Bradyrhizobium sp. 83012]|uniref:Uncharacterized protein n=1 Tax=Bradyrhizobium aeschynomenes TaxID=2734909 RepID=A0ABX2CRT2_9BRAD|nr:hypothetical protein [Bradyrhizobium aeschynomenes]NPU69987.1 hypothetical protein [Bradyrhizobium aeschynomenes]
MSQDLHDGIVLFAPLSPGCERILLGTIEIGEIRPTQHPSARLPICFKLDLPNVSSRPWHPAQSIEDARRLAAAKIGDWIDAAGLVPVRANQQERQD